MEGTTAWFQAAAKTFGVAPEQVMTALAPARERATRALERYRFRLAGKRIFIVHYPHYARAMALTGDWDMVCCGHSHKVEIDTIENVLGGQTAYVNPGTIGGVGTSPATWILADLDTMSFEVHEVDKAIEFRTATAS